MTQLKEMTTAVKDVVWQLADKKEREDVLAQLSRYVRMMDEIQTLPMVPRLRYYRAVTAIYDCLRRLGQLGRREGGLDPLVKTEIENELFQLMQENGHRKD